MRVQVKTYWIQKAGYSLEEYEDAFYPKQNVEIDNKFSRYAIADGASESSFSREWAQVLVHSYFRGRIDHDGVIEGNLLRKKWLRMLRTKELPWFAEEKMKRGAFSTLLGIDIFQNRTALEYRSLAIGDSCLFHIRDGQLLKSWPIVDANEFGNRPYLISSDLSSNRHLKDHILKLSGRCKIGDHFLLMTDALACWFIRYSEVSNQVMREFISIPNLKVFREKVLYLRRCGLVRNDDSTMMRLFINS